MNIKRGQSACEIDATDVRVLRRITPVFSVITIEEAASRLGFSAGANGTAIMGAEWSRYKTCTAPRRWHGGSSSIRRPRAVIEASPEITAAPVLKNPFRIAHGRLDVAAAADLRAVDRDCGDAMGGEPRDGDFYVEGCVRFFRIVVAAELVPVLAQSEPSNSTKLLHPRSP